MDKKKIAYMAVWLVGGIAMIIMGIRSVLHGHEALSAISKILGTAALITGIVTLFIRLSQLKMFGREGKFVCLDGIVWIVLSILLFNTGILNKLGKITFVVIGIILLYEGVRSLHDAFKEKQDQQWYIPRIVFSAAFIIMGVIVICNAEKIFTTLIGGAVGIYLIIHGANLLYDWLGRVKYYRNFRNLD